MKNLWSQFFLLVSLSSVSAMAQHFDAAENTDQGIFQVSGNWSTLTRGSNTLQLLVRDGQNSPLTQATVDVVYNMMDMDMRPRRTPVTEEGNGVYTKAIQMGMCGNWYFDITITKDGQTDTLRHIAMAHSPEFWPEEVSE